MDARPADGVSPYTSLTADNPWTKTGWPTPAPPPTGRATLAGTDSSSGDPAGTAEAIWIAVGGVVILVALFIGAYVVYMRVWYDVGAGEALARLLCGNSGGGQIGAVWKPRGATRGVDLGGRHSTANSGPEFFRRQAAAAAASAPASTSASASARAPASAPALTPSGAGRAIAYPSTPSSEHERDESFISFGASSVSPFERIAEASTSRRAEPPLAPGASAAVSPLPASQPIQPGRSDAPSMYVTGKLKAKHHHYHHHHQHHHPHHHHPHTQAHSEPKHGKHGQSSAAPLQPATGSALPPHLPVQHASDTMIAHAPSSPAVTADVSTSLVLAADEDLGTGVSLLRQSLVPFSSVVYVEGDDSASGGDGFSTLRRGRPSTKGEHPAPGADSTTAILGSMFVPMPKAKTDHEKSTTPAWAARSTPGADTSAAADMRSKTYPPPLMPQPLPYAAFATPNVTKPAATATASSGLPRQHVRGRSAPGTAQAPQQQQQPPPLPAPLPAATAPLASAAAAALSAAGSGALRSDSPVLAAGAAPPIVPPPAAASTVTRPMQMPAFVYPPRPMGTSASKDSADSAALQHRGLAAGPSSRPLAPQLAFTAMTTTARETPSLTHTPQPSGSLPAATGSQPPAPSAAGATSLPAVPAASVSLATAAGAAATSRSATAPSAPASTSAAATNALTPASTLQRSDDAQSQREHAIEFLKFASLQRSRSKSSAASSPGMGLDDAHRRDEHPTSGQGGAPRGRSPATLERHRTVEHQLQQLVTVVHDPAAEHHMSMTPSILFSPHAGMHIGGHGGGDTASVAYTFDSAETGVPVRRGTLATMASSTGARSIERARSLARSIERGAARGAITDTLVESPVDEPRGLDADKPPASQPPQHLSLEEPMQLQQPPQPQQQADEAVTPESTRFDLTFISVDSNREGTTRASLPAGGRGSGSSGSNRSSGFHAGLAGRFLLNALAAADAFDLNAVYTMPRTPQAAPLPTPPVPPAAEPSAAEARSLPCASDGGADGLTAGGRKRDMRLSALPPAPPGSVASSGPSIAATPISTHTALAEAPQLGESTDGSCASASPARDARQLKGAGPGPRARGPRDGISPAGFRGILSPLADSVAHTPATETDALMPVADASPSGYFDYRGPHAPARCEADGSGTPRSKLTGAVRLSSIAFDMGGHSRIDSGASSRSHGSANSSSNFLGKSSGGNTDARAGTGAEMQAEADDKAWNRARFSSMVSLCTDVSADLTVSLAGIISGTRRESTLSLGGGAGGISVRRVSRASAAHRASARLTLHARSSSDSSASLSMFSEAILLLRPGAAGFSRMAGAVES
ncbi:hypothetical protein HK105_209285 [Polyrhizophydium stewartii]|uniref:Uncharacterized protein n=1 Tax=Polyrhizophydium stewartii TaxID=2732419 RepID=A0ABR4MVG7_9FUNG